METKFLSANNDSIELACQLLQQGEVVALPTETVYGLAADCRNSEAIKKIFRAKNRPCDNPLIVHIADLEMLNGIVNNIPDDAKILSDNFWPGPLTIIMQKGEEVCNETSAGLDSVGVRMPSHPIAREIIRRSGVPFSAPSANLSGKPSPTNAKDVYLDMNGRIPLIIDGGECDAGIESTVISVLTETPTILRPGIITQEMIEKVLNKKVLVASAVTEGIKQNEQVLSPGMKYKHYAPKADVTILKGSLKQFISYVSSHNTKDTCILCFEGEENLFDMPAITFGRENDATSQAKNLFSALRKIDQTNAKIVFARCPKTSGISLAVYNRLIRSAGFKIIEL